MPHWSFALVMLLPVAAYGCGDRHIEETTQTGENTTVLGGVDGEAPVPVTVMAGTSPGYGWGPSALVLSEHTAIRIEDFERICGVANGPDVQNAATNSLLLDLFEDSTQPDSRVTGPGTFEVSGVTGSISSSRRAIGTLWHESASGSGWGSFAQSGTVIVTDVSTDGISGSI